MHSEKKGQGAMPLAQVQGARSPLPGLGRAQAFHQRLRASKTREQLRTVCRCALLPVSQSMQMYISLAPALDANVH